MDHRGECVNESRDAAPLAARVAGSLAVVGGTAWPAASRATAHRRGPLPAPRLPRTRRQPGHPPLRTRGDRACKNGGAVLLAPGIVSLDACFTENVTAVCQDQAVGAA